MSSFEADYREEAPLSATVSAPRSGRLAAWAVLTFLSQAVVAPTPHTGGTAFQLNALVRVEFKTALRQAAWRRGPC